MRSSTRFSGVVLLVAWTALAVGCGEQARKAPEVTTRSLAPLGQNLGSEVEPNATSGQATVIGNDVVIRANAMPAGDIDFFRFSAEAGTRVYAATMTAFSSAGDLGENDSALDLLGTNGTTLIQSDDDHGSMGDFASSIAGAAIPARGNYYFRVREIGGAELRPYDLHFRLREGAPSAEAEPNNTTGTAEPLPASGWVAGAMLTASDVDVFSLTLAAGDTIFASLDLDPERNGTTWDGELGFGPFGGTFVTVDDDTIAATRSEALFATVKSAGTYYVRVVGPGGVLIAGNYQLSVSVHPATAASATCTTYASTDVPKALTDAGRSSSTISVPGTPRIQDLDISVQLSHAFPEDLDVHLRSPAGSDVALFTDVGSASFPNIDLALDDEAAFPLTQSDDLYFPYVDDTALVGLGVQPETSNTNNLKSGSRLAWFDGQNAGGTWTLVLDDDEAGNTGTLTSWAITVCESPARVCPNGSALMSALAADFESGVQGFTSTGQWARGTPSGPPTFVGCSGGTQCWKTNLAGSYAPLSTSNLVSPAINLTNAVAPITLQFALKYQIESASFDHAWVEIRDMGPTGTGTRRVLELTDPTMREVVGAADTQLQETAGWGIRTLDLSAYAGRTIQVGFHLDADDGLELGGLAVDDVSVAHCGCGDGAVGPGEQCDAGNLNGQQGACCTANCQFVGTGTGCSDGTLCTTGESCTNGVCGGGTPITCDDMNVCTNNSCDPTTGCSYVNNTSPCPGGTCIGGACQPGSGGMGGGGAGGAGAGGTAGGGASGGAGAGGSAGAAAGAAGTAGSGGGAAGGGGAAQGGMSGAASGGMGGRGGSAGMPPGGDAGESGAAGAPDGGTSSGGTAGEGGEATGGSSPRGGSSTGGRGGSVVTGGTGDSGGEGGEATGGTKTRHASEINADSSCGCRVPVKSKRDEVSLLFGIALGVAALRRRKHRFSS